ncbi:MAG: hypothetical protein VX642_00760 [Bdellovibrionota bacterium]|nr:hypothetical protein [Bdellovibrionota bacterium]
MKNIDLAKEHHYYLTQVLGVNRAYFASEPAFTEELQEASGEAENRPHELIAYKRYNDASWLVLADIEGLQVTAAEIDLLEKMLGALGVPEKLLNLTLVPSGDLIAHDFRSGISTYKKILCLGENAKALLQKNTKDLVSHDLNVFFQQKMVCSFSAEHLLKNPNDKKRTWASMQALMKA